MGSVDGPDYSDEQVRQWAKEDHQAKKRLVIEILIIVVGMVVASALGPLLSSL